MSIEISRKTEIFFRGVSVYSIFEELCNKNGVTPYKVGKETKIATSTLSDWKSGKSTPKQDKLKKIAAYFNVSIDYLMTGKEVEFTVEMAEIDLALSNMSKQLKEYALKLAELPKEKQENIMSLIDMLLQ